MVAGTTSAAAATVGTTTAAARARRNARERKGLVKWIRRPYYRPLPDALPTAAGTLTPVRVDQVVPSLASRDAIGVHTLALTAALREAGFDSEIYYGTCTPDVTELAHPVIELGRATRGRWLLYQSSIGSPVYDIVAARSEPKLVNYHNITPAALLERWEPAVGYEVRLGRAQLERLAPESRLAVADSAFNETELVAAGYTNTAVVPLLIEMTGGGIAPDPVLARQLADAKAAGGADLLFVGKVSPHKAPHDLVKMLAVYRRLYDPEARLHLVGSPLGETYARALGAFVEELGLAGAVTVTGSVDQARLEAYYSAADVFVCASEHEGFCVPIVEAMGHGIPVVAYGVTAVPETVGDAGLILPDKDPLRFAAAVDRVVRDGELRRRLAAGAAGRVAAFSLGRSRSRFVELIRQAVEAA